MTTQVLSSSLASLIQKHNLDISIVELQKLWTNIRLDSDFYSQSFATSDNTKIYREFIEFTDFIKKGIFDISPSNYVENGWVPFVRSGDLKDVFVWAEWMIKINEESHKSEIKTELGIGDMLISKVGTIWDVAINLELPVINFSQNVIWIKIKAEYKPISGYLSAFLNCKFWRNQIEQKISGQVQFKITLEDIRTLQIPLPSPSFQSSIASLVQEAHKQRELSKSLYAEAEKILLSELGLLDWKPTEENIDIKTNEEVQLFGRCDAEFFQPKYDELFEKLSKFETRELGSLVDYSKGVEPWTEEYTEDDGVPFVRVSDVDIQGIERIEKKVSFELAKEYDGKYSPKKDDILFTKDGTIGISFVVNKDMEAVLSSAFLRFQKKEAIESEYLALILNSIVCKLQIERLSGGAIIAHLKPSDAMTLKIPILSPAIQSKISSLIISSHEARTHSKELLDRAKRAVEVFIEEDEEAAENFLNIK